jgi:hypothetical protein
VDGGDVVALVLRSDLGSEIEQAVAEGGAGEQAVAEGAEEGCFGRR